MLNFSSFDSASAPIFDDVDDHRNLIVFIDHAPKIWGHNAKFFAVDALETCIVSPEFLYVLNCRRCFSIDRLLKRINRTRRARFESQSVRAPSAERSSVDRGLRRKDLSQVSISVGTHTETGSGSHPIFGKVILLTICLM